MTDIMVSLATVTIVETLKNFRGVNLVKSVAPAVTQRYNDTVPRAVFRLMVSSSELSFYKKRQKCS